LSLLAVTAVGNVLVWAVWVIAAATCLGTGVLVVTRTNPFHSALSLIGNLGSLAVLYCCCRPSSSRRRRCSSTQAP
jgi:NADH:ubiquinone oxidoreductase subunit 6 (subunit J)